MLKYMAIYVWITAILVACTGVSATPEKLTGTWQSVKSEENPQRLEAEITEDEMKISILGDDGTRMLYWLGTVPESVTSGEVFVSEADVEALSNTLMGSMDETKEFTYEDGELRFEQGLMGVSWIVTMQKVE